MNNEPVAWMDKINTFLLDKDYKQLPKTLQNGMSPLYTHPVKELTDEEIMDIFNNWTNSKQEHNLPANNINYFYQEMRAFAKAILRKAQEK
jgi:hypothetical protein